MHPFVGGRLREPAEWYTTVIWNARDNEQELNRIRVFVVADECLSDKERKSLVNRIEELLPDAQPEPPPRGGGEAAIRRIGGIEDTTVNRPPQWHLTFIKRLPGGSDD